MIILLRQQIFYPMHKAPGDKDIHIKPQMVLETA